ncbi:MAG: MliC family protein [Synechococcus sp.]
MPKFGRIALNIAIACAGIFVASQDVSAVPPSYDCNRASVPVEHLICGDEGLAALDRKLADVYASALARSRQVPEGSVENQQLSWLRERNDCDRSKNARACVETSYRLRIAELQAAWNLVTSNASTTFSCNGNAADKIVALYYPTTPAVAGLERGNSSVMTFLSPSASGARYSGDGVEFWTQGNEALVNWQGEELKCTVRRSKTY